MYCCCLPFRLGYVFFCVCTQRAPRPTFHIKQQLAFQANKSILLRLQCDMPHLIFPSISIKCNANALIALPHMPPLVHDRDVAGLRSFVFLLAESLRKFVSCQVAKLRSSIRKMHTPTAKHKRITHTHTRTLITSAHALSKLHKETHKNCSPTYTI